MPSIELEGAALRPHPIESTTLNATLKPTTGCCS